MGPGEDVCREGREMDPFSWDRDLLPWGMFSLLLPAELALRVSRRKVGPNSLLAFLLLTAYVEREHRARKSEL